MKGNIKILSLFMVSVLLVATAGITVHKHACDGGEIDITFSGITAHEKKNHDCDGGMCNYMPDECECSFFVFNYIPESSTLKIINSILPLNPSLILNKLFFYYDESKKKPEPILEIKKNSKGLSILKVISVFIL